MKPDSLCPFKDDRCQLGKCGFCERLRQAREEALEPVLKQQLRLENFVARVSAYAGILSSAVDHRDWVIVAQVSQELFDDTDVVVQELRKDSV